MSSLITPHYNPSGLTMKAQRSPAYGIGKKEKDVPLYSGEKAKTKEGFSANVKTEMEAGNKPQKQAVAIAYSKAGEHRKTHRHKEHR